MKKAVCQIIGTVSSLSICVEKHPGKEKFKCHWCLPLRDGITLFQFHCYFSYFVRFLNQYYLCNGKLCFKNFQTWKSIVKFMKTWDNCYDIKRSEKAE